MLLGENGVLVVYFCALLDQEVAASNPVPPGSPATATCRPLRTRPLIRYRRRAPPVRSIIRPVCRRQGVGGSASLPVNPARSQYPFRVFTRRHGGRLIDQTLRAEIFSRPSVRLRPVPPKSTFFAGSLQSLRVLVMLLRHRDLQGDSCGACVRIWRLNSANFRACASGQQSVACTAALPAVGTGCRPNAACCQWLVSSHLDSSACSVGVNAVHLAEFGELAQLLFHSELNSGLESRCRYFDAKSLASN